jgi:hypothetical protein
MIGPYAAAEEEEGLHGVHRQLRRNKHPKTKEGCKKFSGKQAVTHRRPTPRKPLYARLDTWLCRHMQHSVAQVMFLQPSMIK